MYQPQQILNLEAASMADSSALSGAGSLHASVRNLHNDHAQSVNFNDDLAQLDK